MFLKYIKDYCEVFNGYKWIEKNIITVQVHFHKFERHAKLKTGKLAGFKDIKLLINFNYIWRNI